LYLPWVIIRCSYSLFFSKRDLNRAKILLVLYSSISNTHPYVVVVSPYTITQNYKLCSTGTAHYVLLAILGFYKLVIIVIGCYLTIKIRNVPYKVYNESKVIIFSMYNLVFFAALLLVIQLIHISENDQFIVSSVLIILGIGITVATLFTQKVYLYRRNEQLSSSYKSSFSHNGSNLSIPPQSEASYAALAEKVGRLEDQIEILRRIIRRHAKGNRNDELEMEAVEMEGSPTNDGSNKTKNKTKDINGENDHIIGLESNSRSSNDVQVDIRDSESKISSDEETATESIN